MIACVLATEVQDIYPEAALEVARCREQGAGSKVQVRMRRGWGEDEVKRDGSLTYNRKQTCQKLGKNHNQK
jgi:hypothetical protein